MYYYYSILKEIKSLNEDIEKYSGCKNQVEMIQYFETEKKKLIEKIQPFKDYLKNDIKKNIYVEFIEEFYINNENNIFKDKKENNRLMRLIIYYSKKYVNIQYINKQTTKKQSD